MIVGKIGDDLRMDYTAQGHTVGLAQRMEPLAPADGSRFHEHTQSSSTGTSRCAIARVGAGQGVREPVGVFVLEGVGSLRTRLDISRARGLSRFVGRGDEMARLESALARSLEGTGRVAASSERRVSARAGCVSSSSIAAARRGLIVYEAHCPAHGKTIPYLPLLELLRNLFGIADQDGPREARRKNRGRARAARRRLSPTTARWCSTSSASSDPKAPRCSSSPRCGSGGSSRSCAV